MMTDSSLLSSELELKQQEELYQQLLLQTMQQIHTGNPDSKVIRPEPGMCVKTLSEPGKEKVFINICQSNSVPPPPELSRDELVELLQSEDPSGFRVPMSLGEPHTEVDNRDDGYQKGEGLHTVHWAGVQEDEFWWTHEPDEDGVICKRHKFDGLFIRGADGLKAVYMSTQSHMMPPVSDPTAGSQGCTAYDVVINQEFFQKCQKDPLFQQFVILVSVEGLENKYSLELNREWKVLKNRKFLGSVSEQNIRTKSRPVIQELQPEEKLTVSTKSVPRPEFTLIVEPPAGDPEYLIAEIKLPGVVSSHSLVLDVGEDRLVLTARPSLFHLDIFHPFLIDQETSVAQYNSSTKILTVTMPVVS